MNKRYVSLHGKCYLPCRLNVIEVASIDENIVSHRANANHNANAR